MLLWLLNFSNKNMADKEEQEGTSEPVAARRAESLDSEGVARLIKRQTENLFGRVNTDDIIEKANLAITLSTEENQILAFAAFYDHPSLANIEQSSWETWLHSSYQCPKANPLNSLFLRLFVAQDGFSQGALGELLKSAFIAVPLLHYVFLCLSPGVSPGSALEFHFTPLNSLAENEEDILCLLYVTYRHQHYPMLHIRSAQVEDNDDLQPIIQQCSPEHLINQYGDFFIAELIESQDEAHQTVVAEVGGRAVGFMSVTTDVELSVLWDSYQLEPYHGLRKPCDQDVITSLSPVEMSKSSTSSLRSNRRTPQEMSSASMVEEVTEGEKQDLTKSSGQTSEQSISSSQPMTDTTIPVVEKVTNHVKNYILFGPSNVMAVQLFCMDEQYEMRAIDFLPSVFQLFPDIDFLILTVPPNLQQFPLLSHFNRISPKGGSTVSQELYLLHKCSLLHSFQVRLLQKEDVQGIKNLISALAAEDDILQDVEQYLTAQRDPLNKGATPIHAFVAESMDQIVGVVILRREQSLPYLRSHYNIEDYVYFAQHCPDEHAHLHHFLLNPVFAPHIKHLLKEAMRLSYSNNIYYPLPLNSVHKSSHSLTMALGEMVPVKPRRQIIYPQGLDVNAPSQEIVETKPNATLYHTNRKLSLEPKISINARIVFVGASDTALACLETLVFSPHLKFNNLVLLSPNGLPNQPLLLPDSCCFFDDALSKIGLEGWVTVVPGSLTAINRESQNIRVKTDLQSNEDYLVSYDYLVLCTGLQYCTETPQQGKVPENGVVVLTGDSKDIQIMDNTREAVGEEGQILLYGSQLATYRCLQYLLEEWGLPGSRITWVQPHPPVCFGNSVVRDKIDESVALSGVAVIQDYIIHRYYTDDSTTLTAVELTKDDNYITVDCKVMFCLETKGVNVQSFQAINNACLVFDNRLVINPQHATNDPLILGAGPLTKYSRYYRTQWSHECFNSHEVGQRLANTLLSKVDPTYFPVNAPSIEDDLIPTYSQPKVIYTQLPGHYYYLHIDKPSIGKIQSTTEGQMLSTQTDNGYFGLFINQYNKVETVTVLSNKSFEVSNYLYLYNTHEQYLNNLLTRWQHQLIPDFFLYFREQWACAIFHDRFPDFLQEVQELLSTPLQDERSLSLKDKVQEIIEDSTTVSLEGNQDKVANAFSTSDMRSILNKRLHRYLHYNAYHLPMYAQPDMI